MIRSFFASCAALLVMVLAETAILSNITWIPVFPDFVLLAVLYFSLYNGRLMGETTGFVSGLFIDCLSVGPFGLNCLFRTIIGYAAGFLNRNINSESVFNRFLLGVAATFVKAGLLWLLSLLYPSSVYGYPLLSILLYAEAGLNGIFAPIVFGILDSFGSAILLRAEDGAANA